MVATSTGTSTNKPITNSGTVQYRFTVGFERAHVVAWRHTAWCGAPYGGAALGNTQSALLLGLWLSAAQPARAKASSSREGGHAPCRLAFKFPQAAFRPACRRPRPDPHRRTTVTTLTNQQRDSSRCTPAQSRRCQMAAQAMRCAYSQMSVRAVSPASSAAHSSSSPSCCGNGPQRWHAISAEL